LQQTADSNQTAIYVFKDQDHWAKFDGQLDEGMSSLYKLLIIIELFTFRLQPRRLGEPGTMAPAASNHGLKSALDR
jgi:hypothetical protein